MLILCVAGGEWQVEVRITCFPSFGVVRIGGSITPKNQVTELTECRWQWTVPIPVRESPYPIQVHRVQGVRLRDQGSFPTSFLAVNQPLGRGPLTWGADNPYVANHPTSSNMWLPWVATIDDTGVGAAFGLEWSGLWRAQAEWLRDAVEGVQGHVKVTMGSVFTSNVNSGTEVELPATFAAYTQNGLASVSQQIHAYTRAALLKRESSMTMPWVQFNSWYPWTSKLHSHEMEKQLGFAAQLGFEVFVLDDGWFYGGYEGAPWGAGAGLWIEDQTKFTEGIKTFGDKVHAHGMKFGLWIEPERIDPRVLPQTDIRPAWIAGDDNNQPYEATQGSACLQLCLGCPESVEWTKRQIDRLVVEYGADWIKWDHNRYRICQRRDHGHQMGDGNQAHIWGLYDVFRYIGERYPHVVIENCASGGARVDYGVMKYTHINWLHDIPSPSYRARSQFAGAALAYPPEYLNSWVIPDGWEPLTEKNARFKLRSCMLGAFGVSYPLYQLSTEVQVILKEEIAHYKRLRSLIQRGRYVPLLPQPTSLAAWSAYAYILDPAEQQASNEPLCGVIVVFRGNNEAVDHQRLLIPGLEPEKQYHVIDQDSGNEWFTMGASLANHGLDVTLNTPNSCTLWWVLSE